MEAKAKEIYPTLKKIESEIQVLKLLIIKSKKTPKKIVKLEGALEGIKVSEEEIEEAKRALFKLSV
jgi:hypothetical protein